MAFIADGTMDVRLIVIGRGRGRAKQDGEVEWQSRKGLFSLTTIALC